MNFLKFLLILLIISIATIAYGFYTIDEGDAAQGHKYIGLSTLFIFFIIMPLFIWTRYRKKDLSKFNFNQRKDDEDDWNNEDKSSLN